jgi:hypothetical protein
MLECVTRILGQYAPQLLEHWRIFWAASQYYGRSGLIKDIDAQISEERRIEEVDKERHRQAWAKREAEGKPGFYETFNHTSPLTSPSTKTVLAAIKKISKPYRNAGVATNAAGPSNGLVQEDSEMTVRNDNRG